MKPTPTKIDIAVEPLRAAAREMAKASAARTVERVRKALEEAGGDLQKVAPYPSSFGKARLEYHAAVSKYTLFRKLTVSIDGVRRLRVDAPEPAVMNEDQIAKFIKDAQEAAEAQFVAYAQKLNHKVGAVESAALSSGNEETGENLWAFSELRIVTAVGEKQLWRTRLIHNTSKLGAPFIQFPTRLVKKAGG